MLARLTIENYALIDHLEIEFPGDLVIITGETGAGKSILLGALSLLFGGKADAGVIKDNTRNCVVEAEFRGPEGKETIVRRVLSPSGRSRSFVDDEPVTMDELGNATSGLVDIHSQHQHLLLADRKFQISVLDSYAGILDEVERYSHNYESLVSARRNLEAMKARLSASEKEREYLEFQYSKLEEAKLRDGELQELEIEQIQLANSELIKENLSVVSNAIEGDETNILSSLKEAENALFRIREFVPAAEELASRVESARIELKDVAQEADRTAGSVVCDPSHLEEVENRIGLICDLMRRHGVSSVAELIALRDEIASKLGIGVDAELEKSKLEKEVARLEDECRKEADEIHNKRIAKAPQLSELLQESVRNLEMPLAKFEVRVSKKDSFGIDGCDDILFYFNANGAELRELSKCASGGELSRIMLCLKALMCRYKGMPTVIFDEIDTGVSGSIADKMGRIIVGMGSNMQVVAITHLPQVASKGSAHFLVYKEGNPVPATKIRHIEGEEREREIARMLSGSSVTNEALANARVLLNEK